MSHKPPVFAKPLGKSTFSFFSLSRNNILAVFREREAISKVPRAAVADLRTVI